MEEGVIKYHYERVEAPPPDRTVLQPLIDCRRRCYEAGYIGLYPDGIGYGNLSIRSDRGFIISGTQTGGIAEPGPEGYCEVIEADIERNRLLCRGPIAPSSEALTHAAFYRLDPGIGCVVHIHNRELWEQLLNVQPTTAPDVPYGTPAMAREIERLWKETNLRQRKIVVMAGHEEGIVWFGEGPEEIVELRLANVD